MKFTLDTANKRITLVEDCSFEEIEKIKRFVGKDIKNWKISVDTQFITQYIDRWHARPYFEPFTSPNPIWDYNTFLGNTHTDNNIMLCDTKVQAGDNEIPIQTFNFNN